MTMLETFESRVVKADGCWEWTGAHNTLGYGHFWYKGAFAGVAHRVAYEAYVGPVPDGLVLDHLCRNRGCCNPAHLEPITQRENILRGDTVPARRAAQTHCKRGHKFTEKNTYISARGERVCRACRSDREYARRNGLDFEAVVLERMA